MDRRSMKIFWFELNEVARSRSKIWMKVSNHRNEIDEIVLLVLGNLAEAEWTSEWRVVVPWNIFVKSWINAVADRSWIDEWRALSWNLFGPNLRLVRYIDRVWNEGMTLSKYRLLIWIMRISSVRGNKIETSLNTPCLHRAMNYQGNSTRIEVEWI